MTQACRTSRLPLLQHFLHVPTVLSGFHTSGINDRSPPTPDSIEPKLICCAYIPRVYRATCTPQCFQVFPTSFVNETTLRSIKLEQSAIFNSKFDLTHLHNNHRCFNVGAGALVPLIRLGGCNVVSGAVQNAFAGRVRCSGDSASGSKSSVSESEGISPGAPRGALPCGRVGGR